ncbi:hypothetical protein D3C76_855930 [compost metagenome]
MKITGYEAKYEAHLAQAIGAGVIPHPGPITENIMGIQWERCAVTFPQKGRGRRPIRKLGTIVGAYANAYWHPHMYNSYHIVFDDGTRTTVHWKEIEFLAR